MSMLRHYASVLTKLHDSRAVREMALSGGAYKRSEDRACPCCNFAGKFASTGVPPRHQALCPQCGSVERHRLFRLLNPEFADKRVLHFAPEAIISDWIKQCSPAYYQTADLSGRNVDRALDVEALDLPSESLDMVLFFHVLEHVDDSRALAELFRVLAPGAKLFIMVPIIEGWDETYEDASQTTDEQRARAFGQFDHVRFYGRDLRQRITAAGFGLEEFTAGPVNSPEFGLIRGEKVFICTRPDEENTQ